MSIDRPVLGLDLGTMTLAAGYAFPGEEPQPLMMHVRSKTAAPHYKSELLISDEDEVRRPDFRGQVKSRFGNLTAMLGQPPQIIAGAPHGINSLIDMLVSPAIEAADRLDARPDDIAAVVPSHWPGYTVDQYCTALAATGLNIIPVEAAEALASYAELVDTDGLVTCLNIGGQAAASTLAMPQGKGERKWETYEVTRTGSMSYIAQQIVVNIAARIAPTYKPSNDWLRQATEVGKRILRASQKATSPNSLITASMSAPVGKVNVRAGQVNDLVEDLMRKALRTLTDNPDMQGLWEDDRNAGIPKTLLVAGGFSTNPAVGRAIRTEIGPYRAVDYPQAVPAMGAARYVAEGGVN